MPIKEGPQVIKQHTIPQNIMQVEFKVIGELTMRQFFYLVIGSIFAFGALKSGMPSIIRLPVVALIVGGSLAVAFLPIQERGLDVWVVNFFKAIYSPTLRVWRKKMAPPLYFSYQNADIIKSEMMAVAPTASRRKLERYLERETKEEIPDIIDLREAEYIKKVREAYGEPVSATTVLQTTQQYVIAPTVVLEPATYTPPTGSPPQPAVDKSKDKKLQSEPIEQIDSKVLPVKPISLGARTAQTQTTQETQAKPDVTAEKSKIRATAFSTPFKPTKQAQIKIPNSQAPLPTPVTPDRLTGRIFTQLFKTEGEITLPIRGERVLKTSKELSEDEIQEDINEKANKLTDLVTRIRKEEGTTKRASLAPTYKAGMPQKQNIQTATSTTSAKAETLSRTAVSEKPPIQPATPVQASSQQIDSLKKLVESTSTKTESGKYGISEKIRFLSEQKTSADAKIEVLNKQIEDLKQMLSKKASEPAKVVVQKIVKEVEIPVFKASEATGQPAPKPNIVYTQPQTKISPLTNIPNVINGIIKDGNQKLVEGAVVIIVDARGDTVRALRTNKLGQFAITTPVSNGTYLVKVSKDELGVDFDVVSVEVKGEVLPPIELTGRL